MERSLNRPSLSGTKGDARWQAWVAKGHAHDKRVRRRVELAAVSVGSLLALGLAVFLTLT